MKAEELFNLLPLNEKLLLIEKVMPMSGTYRQLDHSGNWSKIQWEMLKDEFINSIDWEQLGLIEAISVYDKFYEINGESVLGNKFKGIGLYSLGELVKIEHLETN